MTAKPLINVLSRLHFGPVDQLGMIAALASLRSRVRIPPGPFCFSFHSFYITKVKKAPMISGTVRLSFIGSGKLSTNIAIVAPAKAFKGFT